MYYRLCQELRTIEAESKTLIEVILKQRDWSFKHESEATYA